VEGLVPEQVFKLMGPELVSPGVLFLVSENAPTKTILGAGAGSFSVVHIYETPAVFLGGEKATCDDVAANWEKISDPTHEEPLEAAFAQTGKFVAAAAEALGVKLGT
jgi:hypothetical protein